MLLSYFVSEMIHLELLSRTTHDCTGRRRRSDRRVSPPPWTWQAFLLPHNNGEHIHHVYDYYD